MKFCRYGKFRMRDYWLYLLLIVGLSTLSLGGFLFTNRWGLFVLPVIYVLWLISQIVFSYDEQFCLNAESITVTKRGKTAMIPLPIEITLIISYASPCTAIAQTRSYANVKSDMLKDKYAVTIMNSISAEKVSDLLCIYPGEKHTTATIRARCTDRLYLYSFVCTDNLLKQLIDGHNCVTVIPRTLWTKLGTVLRNETVYIDESY